MQHRAGVRTEADRLAGMLAPPQLGGGAARFLGDRTFAALTARDGEGRLWTSPLVGPPGFLSAAATTMDFVRRRRIRVNGVLTERHAEGLRLDVDQAFGNCPRYIRPRHLERDPAIDGVADGVADRPPPGPPQGPP